MRNGSLRHRVDIIELVQSGTGDRGGATVSKSVQYASVPASIMQLNGRELEEARMKTATADYKITMRYLPDVDETRLIRFQDGSKTRTFHVENVDKPMEINSHLVILAGEDK